MSIRNKHCIAAILVLLAFCGKGQAQVNETSPARSGGWNWLDLALAGIRHLY